MDEVFQAELKQLQLAIDYEPDMFSPDFGGRLFSSKQPKSKEFLSWLYTDSAIKVELRRELRDLPRPVRIECPSQEEVDQLHDHRDIIGLRPPGDQCQVPDRDGACPDLGQRGLRRQPDF